MAEHVSYPSPTPLFDLGGDGFDFFLLIHQIETPVSSMKVAVHRRSSRLL